MPPTDRLASAIEACKVSQTFKCPAGEFRDPPALPRAVAELDAAWREQADALAAALRVAHGHMRLTENAREHDFTEFDQNLWIVKAALAAYDAALAEAKGATT